MAEELGSQRGDPAEGGGHICPATRPLPKFGPCSSARSSGAVGRGKSSEGQPWAQHQGSGGFPAAPGGAPHRPRPQPRAPFFPCFGLKPLSSSLFPPPLGAGKWS